MRTAIVEIEGVSPYSPSHHHEEDSASSNKPGGKRETKAEYEERTWRSKAHCDDKGVAFIPGISFKMALDTAIGRMRLRIPGKGQSEYGKLFVAGVIVRHDLSLNVHRDKFQSVTVFCHANGKRGSGTRVNRTFPVFQEWGGKLEFTLLDENIPEDVFEKALREAGALIGVGRWRGENGGMNGRFGVKSVKWK